MTHRTAAVVTIVGGVLMAVGSFLPWITARTGLGSVSVNGTDGDGVATLIIGAVIALVALVYLDRPAPGLARGAIILGGLAGIVIAGIDFSAANDRVSAVTTELVAASVGAGLYVLGIGSVAAIVGGLQMDAAVGDPTKVGRVCVNCGKVVHPDREQICDHCGLPFATKA